MKLLAAEEYWDQYLTKKGRAMQDDTYRRSGAGLYFIVGGLVIFAIILGFLFIGKDNTGLNTMSPAAGDYTVNDSVYGTGATPGNDTGTTNDNLNDRDTAPAYNSQNY
jgi:hypothetical protein